MFAIAGVSGKTGKVVADTLIAAGKPIRVIVRDEAKAAPWRARGAEAAVASLDDEAALARALGGASGAYLLSPEDPRSDDPIADGWRMAHAMAGAVEQSRIPHVVFLSTMGAQHAEGTGLLRRLHAAEERLSQVATSRFTFVRAAHFLDNWAMALGAAAGGKLPTFIDPERVLAMVATRDVAQTAARSLLEGPRAARELIEIGGPRDLSPRELAAVIGKLVGRSVEPERVPLGAVVPMLTGMGMSAAFAEQIRQVYLGIADGRFADRGEGARFIRGSTDAETLFAALLGKSGAS